MTPVNCYFREIPRAKKPLADAVAAPRQGEVMRMEMPDIPHRQPGSPVAGGRETRRCGDADDRPVACFAPAILPFSRFSLRGSEGVVKVGPV